jgi:hypothetical protein
MLFASFMFWKKKWARFYEVLFWHLQSSKAVCYDKKIGGLSNANFHILDSTFRHPGWSEPHAANCQSCVEWKPKIDGKFPFSNKPGRSLSNLRIKFYMLLLVEIIPYAIQDRAATAEKRFQKGWNTLRHVFHCFTLLLFL